MLFLLGVLWAQEPKEIPRSDQEVVHYLLEKHSDTPQQVTKNKTTLPLSLQKDIETLGKSTINNRKGLLGSRTAAFPEMGFPLWWGILFAALVLGALRLFVNKNKDQIGTLKVHSRSFFGQDGSLAVVEVKDADQNPRLYLIGLHGKGSPNFLADLSAPIPFPEMESPITSIQKKGLLANTTKNPLKTRIQPSQKEKSNTEKKAVATEDQHEKEALVEHILRLKESKSPAPQENEKPRKHDKWTEGFHEVLRK